MTIADTTGPGTDYLTTAEAGAQLGVQAQRVRQYIYQGRLPGAARRGRDWMIPPKSLKSLQIRAYRRTKKSRKTT